MKEPAFWFLLKKSGLPEPLALLIGEDLARRDYRGRVRGCVLRFLDALAGERVVKVLVRKDADRDPVARLCADAGVDRAIAHIAPRLDAVASPP